MIINNYNTMGNLSQLYPELLIEIASFSPAEWGCLNHIARTFANASFDDIRLAYEREALLQPFRPPLAAGLSGRVVVEQTACNIWLRAEEIRKKFSKDFRINNLLSILGGMVQTYAFHGNLEAVQQLLANGPIDSACRGRALVTAAQKGQLLIMLELFANGPITCPFIKKALIGNQHLETVQVLFLKVQELLASGHIKQAELGFLGEAFITAADENSLAIMQELLANPCMRHIIHRFIGKALVAAAKKGHLSIVQELLACGHPIKPGFIRAARDAATQNGHPEIVQALPANEAMAAQG